jgi:parvulin-like peptidyl-prolyl isomerase
VRRHVKAIVWGLLSGLAIIVLLESFSRAEKPDAKGKVAAMVNGEAVLLEEVDTALKGRAEEAGPGLAPLTAAQQRQQRLEVLSAMVDELLVKQFLREKGFKVEPAEVEKSMATLADSLKSQKKTLADYCKETNQTEQQIRASLLQMLQMNQFVKQQATEEELKKYYDINKDFFDKVTVRCSHVVLRLSPTAPKEEREQARRKLLALRAELVAGKKDFAAAAKEMSHCPSAPKGGDIGYIYRKWQVDENFARAAFALKVDELSDVVETDFGLHLVKATDRKAGAPSKFELCLEDVRDCYAEELRQVLLAKLRQKGKIEILLP